jgi:hypothetical protein
VETQVPLAGSSAAPSVAGSPSGQRTLLRTLLNWRVLLACVAGVLLLAVVGVWWWLRSLSAPINWSSDQQAFEIGSIGTEIAPLVAFEVMPEIFPEYFQPRGLDAGDWVEQFGFVRRKSTDSLPIGFSLSSLQPSSGDGSPVEFVGLACAACHTTHLRTDTGEHHIIGGGGPTVNVIGFGEAVRASILDHRLTTALIDEHQKRKRKRGLSLLERFVVSRWITSFREVAEADAPKYDEPFPHNFNDPRFYPAGPGRTRAFRSLVRVVLDRPGEQNWAITKIPAVYSQRYRKFAQFDGSIEDHNARSALAALTAGATPQSLASRQIVTNIRTTTQFTKGLVAPRWHDFTKSPIDQVAAARGAVLYKDKCFQCHGGPTPTGWEMPDRDLAAEVTPLEKIGTDPARVTFPHAHKLVKALNDKLGPGHPFHPGDKIRASVGYANNPIDGVFARAPYLHNGSILTLAELLHLEPRRDVFFRGRNEFDPKWVGLISPTQKEWDGDPSKRKLLPFKYDVSPGHPGNSNAGHDYPWRVEELDAAKKDALRDLLEFLKTL